MKRYLLSGLVLVTFGAYSIYLRGGISLDGEVEGRHNRPNQNIVYTPQPTIATVSTNTPTSTPAAVPQQTGKYKDGTYTGSVADAFYGNIQVQAVITGGKITDVIFLQYPNDRNTSIEINTQAMPLLKQEAIQVQSAQVDGVSGATASSGAFVESLTNALKQAV